MRVPQRIRNGNRGQGKTWNDLGFGSKIIAERERLINHDGSFNVRRTGGNGWSPYQAMVEMEWWRFFLIVFAFYWVANSFFAFIFVLLGIEHLNGVIPGGVVDNFSGAFFFSIQTFTTVGYGHISPKGLAASLLSSLIALVGLMSFAIATGLMFARFSKPRAQIAFSKHAIISPYKDTGLKSLQFRIANRRDNKIINLHAVVTMSWVEEENGQKNRRFAALELERNSVVMFPLNWTIVHIIDENSPLYGKQAADFEKLNMEFITLIEGFDETYSQQVHINASYTWKEVLCDVRFAPMYYSEGGETVLQLDKIDEVVD